MKKMKTLFFFLSLLVSFSIFSQTNEQILKNNNWYLDHVVINGNTSTPPVDQDIPYIILNFNSNDLFVSTYCNSLFGGFEIHADFYTYITSLNQTLQVCDAPTGVMSFEYLYFNFFFTDQTQPFYYEILAEPNGNKTLTINSASGNEAFYGNQQMSIENVSHNLFQLYPNPIQNRFYVKSKGHAKIKGITVYSLNGKEVLYFKESPQYDLSNLESGIYFVKIQTNDGTSLEKIIKQ